MSQKNIYLKSHKAQSHEQKKTRSSQHSKIKENMADQLRGDIRQLIQKQDEAKAETRKSYDEYKFWKSQNNEAETEFHYGSYRMWSDETHRLGEEIQTKLKAVQKYESPKNIEEPKIINTKKYYMKYGPSDEEE